MKNEDAKKILLEIINKKHLYDYFLDDYQFKDIKDKTFHKLRSKYIGSVHGLIKYLEDERNKVQDKTNEDGFTY